MDSKEDESELDIPIFHPKHGCPDLVDTNWGPRAEEKKKEDLALRVFSVPLSGCFIPSCEMPAERKHPLAHRLFNLGSSAPHIFHITHIPLLELNSNRPGTTSLT